MATPGKKNVSYSTTLTMANTQQTVVNDGVLATYNGKLFIQNPHATAKIMVGLAGESNLSVSGAVGWLLPPGGNGVIIDEPGNNAITAVSDTSSCPITIVAVPGA